MKTRSRTGTALRLRLLFFSMLPFTVIIASADQLDTMFLRGDSALGVEWTPDSVNTRADWYMHNGSTCTSSDTVYRHCDFIPGTTYKSIAYSYGGEDGHILFREKIKDGFLVGSHMCHYNKFGDPSSVIAGTDCSGFICHLWGVPRVSTRELYSQYKVITRDEIDVGDILVKPGSHAVLVVEREDDTHLLIWESTSVMNCCRERSIDLTVPYWDAYYPRRYEGLTSDSHVTDTTPRQMRSFPFVSYRNGRLAVHSSGQWRGTVEMFSLLGRKTASIECSLDKTNSVILSSGTGSGIAIVNLLSENGASYAVSLTALR
jgi:hypothetical protein